MAIVSRSHVLEQSSAKIENRRYDLDADQGETHDLADELPEKLQEMLDYWAVYQEETGAYLRREQKDWAPSIPDPHGIRRPGQEAWSKVDDGSSVAEGDLV